MIFCVFAPTVVARAICISVEDDGTVFVMVVTFCALLRALRLLRSTTIVMLPAPYDVVASSFHSSATPYALRQNNTAYAAYACVDDRRVALPATMLISMSAESVERHR